jgi:hypothetical protein
MDPSVAARRLVREQYVAVRQALTLLDEQVLARYWGEDTPVRAGYERFLGSLDEAAGRLLGDEELARRGETRRRTGPGPASGTTPQPEPGEAGSQPAAQAGAAPEPPADEPARPDAEPWSTATAAAEPETVVPPAPESAAPPAAAEESATPPAAEHDIAPTPAAEPVAAATPVAGPATVAVTFTLPAEVAAISVALCGEFNDWATDDILLERGGDGAWRTTVALAPGRSYRYRYLIDGERWENAWRADRYEPNAFGSVDSVVIVE